VTLDKESVLFWRIDESIPSNYFTENTSFQKKKNKNLLAKNKATSYCSKEEIKADVPFDKDFLKEVCCEINRKLGITIAGYDFIIPNEGPEKDSLILVDLNYFSLMKGCGAEKVTKYLNEFIYNSVK